MKIPNQRCRSEFAVEVKAYSERKSQGSRLLDVASEVIFFLSGNLFGPSAKPMNSLQVTLVRQDGLELPLFPVDARDAESKRQRVYAELQQMPIAEWCERYQVRPDVFEANDGEV